MNRNERRKTARALARQIARNVRAFDRECARREHTDTGDAWHLLYDCADRAMRAARLLARVRT